MFTSPSIFTNFAANYKGAPTYGNRTVFLIVGTYFAFSAFEFLDLKYERRKEDEKI